MAKRPLPTPEELRQLLRYEPETGKLFWLPRPVEMFPGTKTPAKYVARTWNARWAGKEAFLLPGTDGYLYGNIWQRSIGAHRVIIAMETGEWPECVDHINHVKTDNRRANLRAVSQSENCRNTSPKHNRTGITGVDYLDRRAPFGWRARIGNKGVAILLGWYASKAEAIAAREAAEKVLGYHPNHGKIIPPPVAMP